MERGRHQDLLVADGKYAEMWHRQQETAELQRALAARLAAEAAETVDDADGVPAPKG